MHQWHVIKRQWTWDLGLKKLALRDPNFDVERAREKFQQDVLREAEWAWWGSTRYPKKNKIMSEFKKGNITRDKIFFSIKESIRGVPSHFEEIQKRHS